MHNEQERLAREWAERIKSVPPEYHDQIHHAAADHILATTSPLTMADVEWDHEKYHLAGAYLNTTNRNAVMIGTWDDQIVTVDVPRESSIPLMSMVTRDGVTPDGKRYELREITEPEHPEVLSTVEDYEDAPEGTIVSMQGSAAVWVKSRGEWRRGDYDTRPSELMENIARTVLRWGWGA